MQLFNFCAQFSIVQLRFFYKLLPDWNWNIEICTYSRHLVYKSSEMKLLHWIKKKFFFCNQQKIMAPLARTRMKAKRTSSSFVAKSPFHQRKKMPIFPVPVSSADVEFNQSDSKKRTTEQISAHYLLEKIGRVLDSCMYCIVCIVLFRDLYSF